MSKIICDVCGTSYPETALQCPICGCVRPGEVKIVTGDTEIQPEERSGSTYTHVKGGRFSKANVRKRNAGNGEAVPAKQDADVSAQSGGDETDAAPEKPRKNQNLGLTITVIALLLAIIAVALYIVLRFFAPAFSSGNETKNTQPKETTTLAATTDATTTAPTQESTVETTIAPVVDFYVDEEITLTSVGETFTLAVTGAEEEVTFVSADEAVATVDENGVVTAVAAGETIITVTCGEEIRECNVLCEIEEEPTQPVEDVEIKLNREDFTMSYKGDTWDLYDGDLDASLITWTSSNTNVATVKDGVVTAVAYYEEPVTITAEYGSAKVTCLVRCNGGGQW